MHDVLKLPYTISWSLKLPSSVINRTPTKYMVSGSKPLKVSLVSLLFSIMGLISELIN